MILNKYYINVLELPSIHQYIVNAICQTQTTVRKYSNRRSFIFGMFAVQRRNLEIAKRQTSANWWMRHLIVSRECGIIIWMVIRCCTTTLLVRNSVFKYTIDDHLSFNWIGQVRGSCLRNSKETCSGKIKDRNYLQQIWMGGVWVLARPFCQRWWDRVEEEEADDQTGASEEFHACQLCKCTAKGVQGNKKIVNRITKLLVQFRSD